uniref:Ubiquitin-like domain-containing protein n=1 Tax=Sinocyclocheilus anshuiensis TaxID=1608454 RepID=A0A671RKT2_9TELE
MATIVQEALAQYFLFQPEACGPRQCVKGDPKDTVPVPFHEPLENTTHAVLQVQGPVSPGPKRFPVNIFNGSNGMKIPVIVRSTDTIEKLQQEVLKLSPDLGASLNLVYNGKPVQLYQTLSELQVKPGATFITYQKCRGG